MPPKSKKTPEELRQTMGRPAAWWERPKNDSKAEYEVSVGKARQKLIEHSQAAMQVEFHTIPLYLYAAYSVIPDHGGPASKARFAILGVVEQEMLHLSLAGNILRALNGSQKLYDKDFVPVYDKNTYLLFDEIKLRLSPLKKPLIETFIKIEAPWEKPNADLKPDPLNQPMGKAHIAKGYHSIGQFYQEFEDGLKEVTKHCPEILKNNALVQFAPDDFFGDSMTVVQDIDTALKAMKKIVDQGEGATGEFEESHYNVFLDLYKRRDEWDCFDVPTNPTTEGYRNDEYIYRLSLALDAAYCYLLQTIDRVWETPGVDHVSKVLRQYLMRNIHAIMMDILTPISDLLVQLSVNIAVISATTATATATTSSIAQNAGPCFNFYPPNKVPMDADVLFQAIKDELKAAINTPRGQEDGKKAKVGAILFSARKCGPRPGMPEGEDDSGEADGMDVDQRD